MLGSTEVSKQASLGWIFLSLPFLHSYSVDPLWCMARPCSAAISPQYLKTTFKLREILRSLCTPCTACGLMETRDESLWYQALLLPPSGPVRSLGFPTLIGISISSAGNPCEAAALPPPHDKGVKVRESTCCSQICCWLLCLASGLASSQFGCAASCLSLGFCCPITLCQ